MSSMRKGKHKHTASYGSVSFADQLETPKPDENARKTAIPRSVIATTSQQQQDDNEKTLEEHFLLPPSDNEEILPLQKVVQDIQAGQNQHQHQHSNRRKQFLRQQQYQHQRHNSDPIVSRNSVAGSSANGSSSARPQSLSEFSMRFSEPGLPNVFGDDDDDDEQGIFPSFHHHWLPDKFETDMIDGRPLRSSRSAAPVPRNLKRRMFLFLTEPTTSIGAAVFFFILIFAIAFMNILMIMQTMNHWQFTPTDCITCGGHIEYIFEDDAIEAPLNPNVPCVCPPTPVEWTNTLLTHLVYFFTVEWTLRVLLFEPPKDSSSGFWSQWFAHLSDATTILDGLAIFPYYLETLDNTNGLMSLRLLRLFRVFQLLRLGQYNTTFLSLTNVILQSLLYLKLLIIALIFGATLFGSLMYWLEKGSWKYHEETGQYRFMRISVDGVTEEPSPFTSIPAAFWWFIVTATTCGYGDVYPTTTGGKWVAVFAMLMGVLVVAFPVSVFSDLWSREVSKINRRFHGYSIGDTLMTGGANAEDNDNGLAWNDSSHNDGDDDDSLNDIYYSTKAKDVETLISSIRMTSPMISTPPPPSQVGASPGDTTATGSLSGKSKNKETVTMKQQDFTTIMKELSTIRDSEFRIRSLLNKYNIVQTES